MYEKSFQARTNHRRAMAHKPPHAAGKLDQNRFSVVFGRSVVAIGIREFNTVDGGRVPKVVNDPLRPGRQGGQRPPPRSTQDHEEGGVAGKMPVWHGSQSGCFFAGRKGRDGPAVLVEFG